MKRAFALAALTSILGVSSTWAETSAWPADFQEKLSAHIAASAAANTTSGSGALDVFDSRVASQESGACERVDSVRKGEAESWIAVFTSWVTSGFMLFLR